MYRDLIHTSAVAPNLATDYIRPLWFVEIAEDLYLWNAAAGHYSLYVPDVNVPPLVQATDTVLGSVLLANENDALLATSSTLAVTPLALKARTDSILAGVPANLNTLKKLALALGNDPAFTTTINTALSQKALLDGSNVATPSTFDNSSKLANTRYTQRALANITVSDSQVLDARDQLTVIGATNPVGHQRFVTLPGLDSYVSLKERVVLSVPLGIAVTMQVADDVILLDGALGPIIFTVLRPSNYKNKPYRIVVINAVVPPVIRFEVGYPMIDLGVELRPTVAKMYTLIPTSIGRWAVS